jgi:hypothetical protein
VAGCGGGGDSSATASEKDRAISEAERFYAAAVAAETDFSSGPCIAERLPGQPDWVVDVAHDPRQPVDDKAVNQCTRYRAGQAHHFVELDLRGELIRAQ